MKNKSLLIFTILLCFFAFNIIEVSAQTQAEIEAMQNGESSKDKGEKKLSKQEKKAKQDADKAASNAKKEADKAKKELDKANAKAKKSAEKANKEAKKAEEKTQKDSKPKKEKNSKKEKTSKKVVADSKPKKEKTTKKTKSKNASSRSSMNKPLKTWSVDIGLNVTNPQTDIRYNDFLGTIDPKNEYKYGGQLRVTKMFDNAIGVQMQFAYNRLQGVYDSLVPYREDRNFMPAVFNNDGIYFRNNVIQGSLNLYWNISNTVFNINRYYRALNTHKAMKKRWFSLYAYSGIGFSIFDPHVMRLSDNASVEDPSVYPGIKFQTNRTTEVVVPLALGTKVKLSKTIDLGLEYGYNFLFTDKLDGFNYIHQGRIKNDGYTHMSLVLTMKLGSKKNAKEHIEWSNAMEPVFDELAKIGKMEKDIKSLKKDEDEDGVSDFFDKDTETPEGVTVGADGRALDIDRDGVIDDNDMELFSGNGAEVDENGRALDTDGDGVPDYKDAEDGTSDGEFVNFQGRSIKDHVKVKNENEGKLRNLALPSIFFDTDHANIKREYEDELFQMALTIKRNKGLKFVLEGHCDERGSDEYNIELGKRRAENVKQYLVDNYQLDPAIFTIVSKGRTEVLSPRYNINRRVDIIIAE